MNPTENPPTPNSPELKTDVRSNSANAPVQPQNQATNTVPNISAPKQPVALAAMERNVQLRRRAKKWMIGSVVVGSAIVALLTYLGSMSDSYEYVQGLSSFASNIAYFLIAGALGVFFAYKAAHPVKLKDLDSTQAMQKQEPELRPVNVMLVFGGFLLGVIPGIFWAFLITYPLSKHACELSGSKYC